MEIQPQPMIIISYHHIKYQQSFNYDPITKQSCQTTCTRASYVHTLEGTYDFLCTLWKVLWESSCLFMRESHSLEWICVVSFYLLMLQVKLYLINGFIYFFLYFYSKWNVSLSILAHWILIISSLGVKHFSFLSNSLKTVAMFMVLLDLGFIFIM